MDLATIDLDPEVVESQLAAYAEHHDRASTAIKTALSALQSGHMVVDLRTVFQAAMTDVREQDEARVTSGSGTPHARRVLSPRSSRVTPSVAIAPASHAGRPVRLTIRGTGDLIFRSVTWRLRVPQTVRTSGTRRVLDRWIEQVPVTPPYVSRQPGDLILWEASWTPVPPRDYDPALLEHLEGWLYVVREVWDLTEIERGVLT
jgi:hypothetical protein